MPTFMYVEMNVFALVVLFLIFLNVYHPADRHLTEQKLFLALIGFAALILILDTAMWLLDGKPGSFIRELYLLVTACYYCLNPLICMTWAFYADYQIYRDEKHLKKLFIPMLIPVCINVFLASLSTTGNYLFYIDMNNVYHRGHFFYLMVACSFIYLFHTSCYILKNRRKMQKQNYFAILLFALPPFIGAVIQSLFYGVSIIWICVTISILIIFINIQNRQLYTDHLTGLFNRRQLDNFLQQQLQDNFHKKHMAGIMIDINSFKSINDLYGHQIGDQALIETAKILKSTFRKSDLIIRYGGDEFVVLLEVRKKEELLRSIERLHANVAQFNKQNIAPYNIGLSIGYDFFDCQSEDSIQEFLTRIDDLMYIDKTKNCASVS